MSTAEKFSLSLFPSAPAPSLLSVSCALSHTLSLTPEFQRSRSSFCLSLSLSRSRSFLCPCLSRFLSLPCLTCAHTHKQTHTLSLTPDFQQPKALPVSLTSPSLARSCAHTQTHTLSLAPEFPQSMSEHQQRVRARRIAAAAPAHQTAAPPQSAPPPTTLASA